jgi:hypothetical protein
VCDPPGDLLVHYSSVPFCAIRLLPLAGKPTMTTHIRVSSTCTPTPLTLELGLVLDAGNINSPWGDHAVLVRRVSAIAVLATDLGGGMAEGMLRMCV